MRSVAHVLKLLLSTLIMSTKMNSFLFLKMVHSEQSEDCIVLGSELQKNIALVYGREGYLLNDKIDGNLALPKLGYLSHRLILVTKFV